MKKYTLEDFEDFDIVNGRIQCPRGDYSAIESFPDSCSFADWCSFGGRCSFGEWCRFGKWCSFGGWCSFGEGCSFGERCAICENKMLDTFVRSVSGLGNEKRTLYLWNTKNGWFAQAGCFFGSESEFIEAVNKKYGEDHQYIKALEFLKTL